MFRVPVTQNRLLATKPFCENWSKPARKVSSNLRCTYMKYGFVSLPCAVPVFAKKPGAAKTSLTVGLSSVFFRTRQVPQAELFRASLTLVFLASWNLGFSVSLQS